MAATAILQPAMAAFRAALEGSDFSGDFEDGLGARVVAATDNSIYEVRPVAVVYPRVAQDINHIVQAAISASENPIPLVARGGNTGTNGQSLSHGVVVDFARYMNRILEVDVANGLARVEPGVVLDQLNSALAEHGLFFPPMVSTASRATIGGMVATDASGKGSRVYGKTSDYVHELEVVLSDATDLCVKAVTTAEAEVLADCEGMAGRIYSEVLSVCRDNRKDIAGVFPDMNRGLTGYNLQQVCPEQADSVSLAYLLAGSEGTLAITKSIVVRLMKRPRHKAMAVLRYDDFDAALRDIDKIVASDPVAVEIIDDKVLSAAKTDIIWQGVEALLGKPASRDANALLFVEMNDVDGDIVHQKIAKLQGMGQLLGSSLIDLNIIHDPATIAELWKLREKAVGLLARLGGGRQGVAFVEDTAVPPAHLADYVRDFRAILDDHGLKYGMFGHADVGCLHVRPFLDTQDPAQAALIRPISDKVAELTHEYGGLLWGEHGRGYRGEYSPIFFGPVLYPQLARIKAAFDPHNIFNPGKLATPDGSAVEKIDSPDYRGQLDYIVSPELRAEFGKAIACNGNGACFSWDALDAMCPSYKASRDRAQSPKGRAALLRAWARLESSSGYDKSEFNEVEVATKASLDTCLSCKACTTNCPVNVDIPRMKSHFLSRYFARHRRPLRHYALAQVELAFAFGRLAPGLTNFVIKQHITQKLVRRLMGLTDLPLFCPAPFEKVPVWGSDGPSGRSPSGWQNVVLVEDAFTASFDRPVQIAAIGCLKALGYKAFRLPPQRNGKMLHLLGFRDSFNKVASNRLKQAEAIAAAGFRMVGLDAAISLMFEQEYREIKPSTNVTVMGLERLLSEDLAAGHIQLPATSRRENFSVFGHCTETSLRPSALSEWCGLLSAAGVAAQAVKTGCCGMAGLFGHEVLHIEASTRLFDLSWRKQLEDPLTTPLVTGFSCRSQAKRLLDKRPPHPVEVLYTQLSGL